MENIQAKAIDLHDPEAQEEWIRLLRRRGELVEGREHAWRSYFILADHLSSCPTPLEVSMQRILSFPGKDRVIAWPMGQIRIEEDLLEIISNIWGNRPCST